MTDETLKLLQGAIRKRGGNVASISPAAEELCRVIDHWNSLHWHDRNRLTEENKRLKERLGAIESKGRDE